jgi:hypothetical protein
MMLHGFKVVVSEHLPFEVEWVFPKDRFVEWRKEDESYCRFAGFGRERRVYTAYQVNDTLVVHPETLEQLRKEVARRSDLPAVREPSSILSTSASL